MVCILTAYSFHFKSKQLETRVEPKQQKLCQCPVFTDGTVYAHTYICIHLCLWDSQFSWSRGLIDRDECISPLSYMHDTIPGCPVSRTLLSSSSFHLFPLSSAFFLLPRFPWVPLLFLTPFLLSLSPKLSPCSLSSLSSLPSTQQMLTGLILILFQRCFHFHARILLKLFLHSIQLKTSYLRVTVFSFNACAGYLIRHSVKALIMTSIMHAMY